MTYIARSGTAYRRIVALVLALIASALTGALLAAPANATPVVNAPVVKSTIDVGASPTAVAVSPDGTRLYVATGVDDSVSVMTATGVLVTSIAVGDNPQALVLSPDGTRLYVANMGSANVSVIDTTGNTVVATISVGTAPRGVAMAPSGNRLYVSNSGSNNVSEIDTTNNTVVATIPVGTAPIGLGVSPNGLYLYVANYGSANVSVIYTSTRELVPGWPQGVGFEPLGVAVGSNGYAYVTRFGSSGVVVISGIFKLAANTVPALPSGYVETGGRPSGVAVSPDGSTVYVANNAGGENSVSVLSSATLTRIATVTVGSSPFGIAAAATGGLVYVGNSGSTTITVLAPAPGPPTAVAAVPGDDTASVSWTVDDTGGSALTRMNFAIDDTATIDDSTTNVVGPHTLTGLANGTSYRVYVQAVNANGASPWSLASSPVTPVGPPTAPTTVAAVPGDGSASVSWTVDDTGGSALTRMNFAIDDTATIDDSTTNTASPHTLTGLAIGTTYRVYVQAVNAAGAGPWSTYASVTPRQAPGAPTGVSAVSGDDTALVSWSLDDTGGAAPTHIDFALDDTTTVDDSTTNTAGPHTLTGLTNGTTYRVYARAVNAAGPGPWSLSSSPVTPVGPPTAPTTVAAVPGDGSASASWMVDDTGGSALTRMNFAIDDTATVDDSTTNTASPHTLTGLTNGTTYRVYVQAVNANGAGPWSLASNPVTPVIPPAPPAPPAPPSQVPTIAPASQSLSGVVELSVLATAAFRADDFASSPRYSIYPTLPAGLSIDPVTGIVSGTPTASYPSTRHWITATAGGDSQSATALLQVYVAEAPEPPPNPTPTLVISGTRQDVRSKPGIRITGTATHLDPGTILRPWIRFPGQASFTQGTAQILVDTNGDFTWGRTTGKKTYVYLATPDDTLRSNRVTIPAA
jgi:YVTN family beta-propeller protein